MNMDDAPPFVSGIDPPSTAADPKSCPIHGTSKQIEAISLCFDERGACQDVSRKIFHIGRVDPSDLKAFCSDDLSGINMLREFRSLVMASSSQHTFPDSPLGTLSVGLEQGVPTPNLVFSGRVDPYYQSYDVPFDNKLGLKTRGSLM